jgi:chromosome segregation protein
MGVLQEELRELTDSVHRDEVARAQQRLRIETLTGRAMEEYGVDPDVLVDEFGPHQPVPVIPDPNDPAFDPDAIPSPWRSSGRSRRSGCGRPSASSRALGRVNPLALEEYAALEERHTFLTTQLEDLQDLQA